MSRWPYQRARLLLAQGRWLRRRREITESRGPLRAARDAFDALGSATWADQARRELRATGESSRRRDPALRDQLTAQELQIAHLAAEGLSKREMGEKLFVSPRTVSTHLYRVYPKLGISARGQLASAPRNRHIGGSRKRVRLPFKAAPLHDVKEASALDRELPLETCVDLLDGA